MSTSLLERNATLFWNVSGGYSMANTKMQKACNIKGDVSLNELGRSYAGFQKMGLATMPKKNPRSDVVNVEYVNSPPNLYPYPCEPQDASLQQDPFEEQFSVVHGGYGGSYCSSNANQFLVRKNPNSLERVHWRATLNKIASEGVSDFGIVVATYDSKVSQGGTVIYSEKTSVSYGSYFDIDVDIPANGDPWIVFSLQHTAGPTGSGSTKYGVGICNWEVKYR